MSGPPNSNKILWTFHRLGTNRLTSGLLARPLRWASWGGFLTTMVWTNPVAQEWRLRALCRLWAWQLWRRLARRPIEVIIDDHWRLYFPTWSTLAGVTAATGLHEPTEELFVFSYLRAGDGVVDVGANLGIYTVACASLGAFVAAIEPSSVSRPVLEHNISINELQNRVQVFATAIGKEDGNAALTTDLDGANHLVAVEEASHYEVVQIRTLDSLVDENSQWFGPHKISFIKVDAEGHDESVLHGARSTIEAHQPVILVESWAGGTEIRALLLTMNYRVYRFDIVEQRLVEYPASWAGQANFIAVADDRLDAVETRLHEHRLTSISQPQIRWRIQDLHLEGSAH